MEVNVGVGGLLENGWGVKILLLPKRSITCPLWLQYFNASTLILGEGVEEGGRGWVGARKLWRKNTEKGREGGEVDVVRKYYYT